MNYRKIFKFMVLILGILLANLVTIWIDNYMLSYKWKYSPHVFTWIGMAIVIVIYYPLFTHIDKWSTLAGNKVLKAGKKLAGRRLGSIIAFLVALLILYFLYGLEWFESNVFTSFFKSL
ncbi:MAG: hypothetical protein PF541_13550 [Prolixibacteraceae bacterium]|jgi:uncharacterized protein YacL|nr:hypothetical protein [Prolixibacteraceae bacterium]